MIFKGFGSHSQLIRLQKYPKRGNRLIPMDYDGLMEKAEEAKSYYSEYTRSSVVADFKRQDL